MREIGARLAVLANRPPNAELIDAELLAIRVQLRKLSEENAEVGARLREPEDKVSAVSGRVRSIERLGDLIGPRYIRWARNHEPWSFVIDGAAFVGGGAVIVAAAWWIGGAGLAVIAGVVYVVGFGALIAWVGLQVRKIKRERRLKPS